MKRALGLLLLGLLPAAALCAPYQVVQLQTGPSVLTWAPITSYPAPLDFLNVPLPNPLGLIVAHCALGDTVTGGGFQSYGVVVIASVPASTQDAWLVQYLKPIPAPLMFPLGGGAIAPYVGAVAICEAP